MTEYSEDDRERLESYLHIHLKKDERDLSTGDKLEALDKRARNKWIQLAINLAAMIFFGYSFYYDITQLSKAVFWVITGVFAVNVGLIFWQKRQIRELRDWLEAEGGAE
ncbi:MAG: hypothetical protein U5K31_05185 [Balneolaceae bacterium]|nr:hypothetical protein [Balneolaceae bacterium]